MHSMQPFSHAALFRLTAGLIGLQFCWAIQVGYVTKVLLQLGLAQRFVSYAWLAGPIAGILVQPTVGVLSDRCTSRFGRRRPFLFVGSAVTVVCLLLFAFARPIGIALGDSPPDTVGAVSSRGLFIAVFSFWSLDFAINAAQGPLRTLLSDVVPPQQHKLGNSFFALATGVGNFSGSLLGSLPLSRYLPFFSEDVQILYSIAVFVLIATMGCTLLSVEETPLRAADAYARIDEKDDAGSESSNASSPSYSSVDNDNADTSGSMNRLSFLEAAYIAPYPFFRVFLVQCFTWFSWFTMFVFATSWVGAEVFNGQYDAQKGSPERLLYDAGVREGNLGLSLQSVVTIMFSLALPGIMSRTSMQTVYFASHILLGVTLSSTLFLHEKWQGVIAVLLFAVTGFSWAVTMAVPWSVMSEAVSKAAPGRAGIYFTMFNLSQCLPEIVVSLVSEEIERVTGSQAAVLFIGGIASFIGGVLILLLGIGRKEETANCERTLLGEMQVA